MAAFSANQLFQQLQQLPAAGRYWLGYSGGADSTALLLALSQLKAQLNAPLQVIHFHHGWHPSADDWQNHCHQHCALLGLPFTAIRLDLPTSSGQSREEQARDARYDEMAQRLQSNDVYLTGHHRDDQAETVLLNLLRGAGVEGMAGIPRQRQLGNGWVARPLLPFRRDDLESFLREHNCPWLEDPSNDDASMDRNYLRQHVTPLLEQRWPSYSRQLSRSAAHASSAARFIEQQLSMQYAEELAEPVRLPCQALNAATNEFSPLLLRLWLRRHQQTVPPESRLREWLRQLEQAGSAEIRWNGLVLKGDHHWAWCFSETSLKPCPERNWSSGAVLELGTALGHLQMSADNRPVELPAKLTVRSRQAGDALRPEHKRPSRRAKELFQSAGTPALLRPAIPVLCQDGQAVAFGDWCLDEAFARQLKTAGLTYRWQPHCNALRQVQQIAVDRCGGLG